MSYETATHGFHEDEAKGKADFEESALKNLSDADLNELGLLVAKCELDQTKDYGSPDYILFQGDVGFMSRGDIQAIKAQQKSGKSMLMDIFMGVMLKGNYGCLQCPHENLKVLYVDTEQHERNTALQSKRVHTICGWNIYDYNPNFQILTLRGQGEETCRQIVEYKIKTMQPDAVFIDGIKDLCENFNDLEKSAELIRWEMNMSKLYNIALCSVLHVNPNSDKMRGHLGTEEQNKCSDVFTVTKDKNGGNGSAIFKVQQTDARNRDIKDFEFVCLDTYGTPVIRTPDIKADGSEVFVADSYKSSDRPVSIKITENDKRKILEYLHNSLTQPGSDAPFKNQLIELIRHGVINLDEKISSDDKAGAWIEWLVNNNYLSTKEGPRKNSTLYYWSPGAVVPLANSGDNDTMPF